MLLSADWVLPITRPAIRDGAVVVRGDQIIEVGPREDLARRFAEEPAEHLSGCTIVPGLVNAHTHLTLSALADVVPPLPFAEWLPRLVAALKPWDVADHEASGVIGAEESLLSGVTVVGDIAYGAAEVASASAAGLGGVYYWELLGMRAEEIDEELLHLRYPADPGAYGSRVACGLSPHSPYTSGPGLLAAVAERSQALGVPTAIHVAESEAEVELLLHGTGPLAATAARTAHGFTPPGTSTVRYLDSLGVLRNATAVHLCHLAAEDVELLAASVRGAVTCPRSNRYLGNPVAPVEALLRAGVHVGVGTDSSASNHDLDLMAEVRALRDAHRGLAAPKLLEMATVDGARAIGVEDRFGAIEPGRAADLAVFGVSAAENPEEALVEAGGRETVRAVMSGGAWRVRDGRLLQHDADAAARAASARERSVHALSPTE